MSPEIAAFLYASLFFLLFWLVTRKSKEEARIHACIRNIRSPMALPIIGTGYKLLNANRQDYFRILNTELKKYAPTCVGWYGSRPEIHSLDIAVFEAILKRTTNLDKAASYNYLLPWLGTGLLTSTGAKWHLHRKLITPTFHFQILEHFLEIFAEKSQVLVQKLEKLCDGREGFDVCPYISRCTLDIIAETAMGVDINAQNDLNSAYVSAVINTTELTSSRIIKPWLFSDFVFYRTNHGKQFKKHLATLHSFTEKVIRERKEERRVQGEARESTEDVFGKKRRKAFLDLLLDASERDNLLSDRDLREEVDTFMFEGHDTTSTSLSWTLHLLGKHPDIQDRVHEELTNIFGGSSREPTTKDLTEMKYLERVLKESLRLYPSVSVIGRTLSEDVIVGEQIYPAGVQIWLHIYRVHRDPLHYPNPDKFDPDNFLPERVQGRHPFAYIPFSAGSRNCIGQKFALLEEKVILSTIIRHYKVTSLDETDKINILVDLVMRPENGIHITLQHR